MVPVDCRLVVTGRSPAGLAKKVDMDGWGIFEGDVDFRSLEMKSCKSTFCPKVPYSERKFSAESKSVVKIDKF